jgi:2-C-methyl-D-erythritol 4-phosphate cytidylyltransferase
VFASSRVWAVVVAGGTGTRFGGDRPKQFLPVAGRRLVDWSVDAVRPASAGVVLVVPAETDRGPGGLPAVDVVVTGGATRSASVRAGLAAVAELAGKLSAGDTSGAPTSALDNDIVIVHDAARPLATPALAAAVVDAVLAGADGAVPGVPVIDTIKQVADGTVVATPERATLVSVQTPQAFRMGVLLRAHADAGDATDDAALVEGIGGVVAVVPGEPANAKVTTADDLHAVEAELTRRVDGVVGTLPGGESP